MNQPIALMLMAQTAPAHAELNNRLVLMVVMGLLFLLGIGLAHPRTRPLLIALVVLVCIGAAFFGFLLVPHVATVQPPPQPVVIYPDPIQMPAWSPAPPPREISTVEIKRPEMNVLAALGQAVVQYWTGRGSPVVAEAPEKPVKTNLAGIPAKPQPPSWVNAPPTMDDHCYRMSVHAGPYTTPVECQRELRKSLQGAVVEYAELSYGPEAAAVRLSDHDLQQLVRERWTEVRPMEIGGSSQDMVSLHALLVFDAPAQQRIKTEVQRIKVEAQRIVIGRRVQGGAVVFGGVIGLLALTWGGLKWATKREQVTTN